MKEMLVNAGNGLRRFGRNIATSEKTPGVLKWVGVGLIAGGAVATVVQSIKASDDVYDMKDTMAEIKKSHEDGYFEMEDAETGETESIEYTDKMYRSDMFWALWECCKKLSKKLAVPATMIFLGVYSILRSNKLLDDRLTQKTLSLMAVERMFNQYRSNVRESEGEEADAKYLFGVKEKKDILVETYDEHKEEVVAKKQKKGNVVDGFLGDAATDYAFIWENCTTHTGNSVLDDMTINSILNFAKQEIKVYGYVTMLDIANRFGTSTVDPELKARWMKAGWVRGYTDDIMLTRMPALVSGSEDGIFGPKTLFALNPSADITDKLMALAKDGRR